MRWFPEESPVGQGTLMPLSHRRAGFRVSIGVIATAGAAPSAAEREPAVIPVQAESLGPRPAVEAHSS
jgi:hypothetical protein